MMTEPMKQRWENVGRGFEALGQLLKERYQSAETPPAGGPDDANEDRPARREAFERLVAAARGLGERTAEIVHDPAVKEQTKRVAQSLNEALTATVDQIGGEVGGLVKRARRAESSPESHGEQEPPTSDTTRP